MIGQYCGNSIPPSHVSSSNEILLHFQSDTYNTGVGFQTEYNPTTAAPTATSSTTTTTAVQTTCNMFTGDSTCDDINNNMECGYDGGDCCGCDVDTFYCTECQCLDPNVSEGGTTCSQTTTVPTTSGGVGMYLL